MAENKDKGPAAEEQKEVAQASEAKAEVGVELSEEDLGSVAGGRIRATDKDGLVRG
jgi:hypothetical protein